MNFETSFEKSYDVFQLESEKLENSIQRIGEKSEKSLSDIVDVYYQIIKVDSMAKLLKENFQAKAESKHQVLLERIDQVQNHLVEKFNTSFHPTILLYLTDLVTTKTKKLKALAKDPDQKSKERIEDEAKFYKELREIMSTKEFVEQYENGLKDD